MRWNDKKLLADLRNDLAMCMCMFIVVIASAAALFWVARRMLEADYSEGAVSFVGFWLFVILVAVAYEVIRRLFGDRLSRFSWPL
jgi:hypothetical protein